MSALQVRLPLPMSASRCKGCNQTIYWCTTALGKHMPMDKIELVPGEQPLSATVRIRQELNHWSSCAERARFAKGNRT